MIKSTHRKVALGMLAGSALLYFVSLLTPAFLILSPHADRSASSGFFALIFGVAGSFSWWANPLFVVAWVCVGNGKSILGLALAVTSLAIACLFLRANQQLAGGSEGMYPYTILYGYYLWLGAIGLCASAALIQVFGNEASITIDERA